MPSFEDLDSVTVDLERGTFIIVKNNTIYEYDITKEITLLQNYVESGKEYEVYGQEEEEEYL